MRISDWSSDVCSSDLLCPRQHGCRPGGRTAEHLAGRRDPAERYRHAVAAPDRGRPRPIGTAAGLIELLSGHAALRRSEYFRPDRGGLGSAPGCRHRPSNGTFAMTWTPSAIIRSEEHTSELQSLMRSAYAVFCLKKNKITSKSTAGQQ